MNSDEDQNWYTGDHEKEALVQRFEQAEREAMTDDGRPVAVPLTQEQARRMLSDRYDRFIEKAVTHDEIVMAPVDAVLSASPEVLAAAMGADYREERMTGWPGDPDAEYRRVIVLPAREVSRGE